MPVTYTEEFLEKGLRQVSLAGTLDAPGAMAIENGFQEVLTGQGGQVIIDLSGVDYMSSYGLRMLMVGAKALHDMRGGLHLAAANPRVMEVIRVAGYDTMFPVYETVQDAILTLTG
jgi:anti-anti-sigma factor